jgi:hypothetical protein
MTSLSAISSTAASVAIMLVGSAMSNAGIAQSSSSKPTVDSMIDDILKQKHRPPQGSTVQPTAPAPAPTAAAAPPATPLGETGMTANEIEALRNKIRPCWQTVAKGATVTIRVEVGRDRVPVKAEIVDKARYASDKDFRAAADATHRAVMNPRCQPWPLSPEKYNSWHIITFNFDPRDYGR